MPIFPMAFSVDLRAQRLNIKERAAPDCKRGRSLNDYWNASEQKEKARLDPCHEALIQYGEKDSLHRETGRVPMSAAQRIRPPANGVQI
jgi:hypothetical protein